MNSRVRAALVLLLMLAALLLAIAGYRAVRAGASAAAAERRAQTLSAAAKEIDTIRAGLPVWALVASPDAASLAKRAGQVVASAGLPASALSSFSTQTESIGSPTPSGARIQRRRASIVLSGVTLPQLGSFLTAWRSQEPDWMIGTIDITQDGLDSSGRAGRGSAGGASGGRGGGDLPLRVVLTAESLPLRRGSVRGTGNEGTRP